MNNNAIRISSKVIKAISIVLMLSLAACAGQRAEQEAMLAQQQAAAEATEMAERARVAESARIEAERSQQELRAELERLQVEREELAAARELAEQQAEERARQAAVLQRQQQQTEIARLQREQSEQIAGLESTLAVTQEQVARREQANDTLNQAITAAEELLQMLASEQLKYENVDAQGNTVEPLQKALISELEARKNALVQQAQALSN